MWVYRTKSEHTTVGVRRSFRRALGRWCALSGVLLLPTTSATVGEPPQPPPTGQAEEKDWSLAERLIREAAGESPDDLMAAIIRLMDHTARHIEVEFDAGAETQALQRRISEQLQEAIRVAAAQRRPVRSSRPTATTDKRRRPQDAAEQADRSASGAEAQDEASAATESGSAPTRAAAERTHEGELLETRRAWGHLPQREREEIIQGIEEQFLERYRVWIEDYYRALQEPRP